MGGNFALTAVPTVRGKDQNSLHLRYVTLHATDGVEMHRWTLGNTATCVDDFAGIIDRDNAEDIVSQLHDGKTVLIHGLYDIEQIVKILGESVISYRSQQGFTGTPVDDPGW